nr:aminoglycoside adenylyltransferase domain-containing protein [Oenococcus sicerae]
MGVTIIDKTDKLLSLLKSKYEKILADNLVGIYLHGSYVMNCYNPAISDLDFIVVIKNPLNNQTKEKIMSIIIKDLWPLAPAKGLEFHVLLKSDLITFVEPVPFDFHFSKMHYQAYLADSQSYIKRMKGTDPDLTAHLMIVRKYGQVLIGRPINEIFCAVPKQAYFRSILFDVADAEKEIMHKPMYIILNLCRVLAFKKDSLVTSKLSGGQWALQNVAEKYQQLIKSAIFDYQSVSYGQIQYQVTGLRDFAEYMLREIAK